MITSNDKQDYTVLFNKASVKLGLIPFDKEVVNEAGEISLIKCAYKWKNGAWKVEPCEPEDFNEKGEYLIEQYVGKDENDVDIFEKVVSTGISSLNDYFQHIHELAELAIGVGEDSRSGSDPYFLRLPLDEPFLEINANTRTITVPAALRQIAVKGDKYAEVVFFKIDRYYDAVDLATRHIYIEWEDAAGNKGISRDFLKDTQSEKDKIIFGWIIDDTLTANVGNIRFAVRFVEWNDGNIDSDTAVGNTPLLYSFSSLPAQMTVVNSLNYSLFEDDEELHKADIKNQVHNILLYLENSDPDSADETTPQRAGEPEFLIDLNDIDEDLITDLENGKKELIVEAVSPDGGVISYTFAYRAQPDDGSGGLGANIRFREVPKATAVAEPKHVYYQKENNGTYSIVSQSDISLLPSDAVVYAKEAYLEVTRPGYYFANVRNNVSGKKTNVKQGKVLYIRYAEAPTVAQPIANYFVLNNQPQEIKEDPDITQVEEIQTEYGTITSYKSNLYIDKGEIGPNNLTLGSDDIGPKFTSPSFGEMTISWYYKESEEAEWESIGSNGPTLEISQPGYYTASANVFANNSNATVECGDESIGIIKVVDMPKMLVSEVKWDEFVDDLLAKKENATLKVEKSGEGEISYQWHKITANKNDLDKATTEDMEDPSGILVFTNGVAEIPFKPLVTGRYYIELKKTLFNAESILIGADKDRVNIGIISVGTEETITPTDGGNSEDEPTNQDLDGQDVDNTDSDDTNVDYDGGDASGN